MQKACQIQKTAFYSTTPHPLALVFFAPLFQDCLLSLSGGGFNIDDPFKAQRLFSLILKSIYTYIKCILYAEVSRHTHLLANGI